MKCSKSAQIIFSQPSEVEARHFEICILHDCVYEGHSVIFVPSLLKQAVQH